MNLKFLTCACALLSLVYGPAQSDDIIIYTGGAPTGEGSSYHMGMGQGVEDMLKPLAKQYGYNIVRVPTGGAVDNARRVATHKDTLVFGIGQGGLAYPEVEGGKITVLRNDLPGECAMAFTREGRLTNWKSITANASKITWVVPENSGSAAFIKKLYTLDPEFGGQEPKFAYVSGQNAIIQTLKNPGNRGYVGFFYAYPNPSTGMVNAAATEDLNVIGVLSPEVAKTDKAFYLNRKAPYELTLFGLGTTKTIRAMCSKALLFVNDPQGITDDWVRGDAEQIIEAVSGAKPEAFIPQNGPLASLMLEVEGLAEEYGVNEMADDLSNQVESTLDDLQ